MRRDAYLLLIGDLLNACNALQSRGSAWRGLFQLQERAARLERQGLGVAGADTVSDIRRQIGEIASELIRIEGEIESQVNT